MGSRRLDPADSVRTEFQQGCQSDDHASRSRDGGVSQGQKHKREMEFAVHSVDIASVVDDLVCVALNTPLATDPVWNRV